VQWLLFLAVLWGAVLIPPWLAERPRDRPAQTMASFHRRLWQLEQLETEHSYTDADEPFDPSAPGFDDDTPGGAAGAGVSRLALRRRRQVFFLLLFAVVGSLGAVVGLRTVTAGLVHVSALVLFTSYVTLLVRHHQRAAEQASKVRYLSPIRAPRPAVVVLRSGTAR
jgi:hypothetical protein